MGIIKILPFAISDAPVLPIRQSLKVIYSDKVPADW